MSERCWLFLILALYALFGLGYSLLMPIWEAPDEPAHYRLALHIAREHEIPSLEENYEATQPPLYYWLASWPLLLLEKIDPDLVDYYEPTVFPSRPAPRFDWTAENYRFMLGPQLLRWLDLLLGSLSVYFIYKGTRRFVPQSTAIPLATTSLAGLTPQFLHMAASVNNDALANLAGAFLFWLLSRVCFEQLRRRDMALTAAAALALPLLIKLTVLPMGLAVLLAVIWRARAFWRSRWHWLLGGGLLVGLVIVAGLNLLAPMVARNLWDNIWWRGFYVRADAFGSSLGAIVAMFASSYWGAVGWAAVGLPVVVWMSVTSMVALGWLASLRLMFPQQTADCLARRPVEIIELGAMLLPAALISLWLLSSSMPAVLFSLWVLGLAWSLHRWFQPHRVVLGKRLGWVMLWIAACLTILVVTKNVLATPRGLQGRFLFPSIGALSLLTTAGWSALLPRRAAPYLPHLTLLLMIALNLLLWFGGIIPTYYQPFLG